MTQRLDVAALRMQTELTGEVTTVQVQSVNSWPKVAFSELKSHETRIDPEGRTIEYVLKLKPKKAIKDFQKLKIIEESVWALFGDTWKTSFKIGSKTLYAGPRRKEIRNDSAIDLGKDYRGFDPTRIVRLPPVRRGQ